MDSSLASIFMAPALVDSWARTSGESPEELQYKLMCTSMELEKAKAEGKLHESKLWRLQELLSTTRKERDEAREECRKLQECLLLQHTPSSADSPCSFMHSSSMVSSPSSSPWSLQELEEHLNNDDFCPSAKAPSPLQLHQALQSFSKSCNEGQDLQVLYSIEPTIESVPEDSQQQFNLEILDQDLRFDADPNLNLPDLQHKGEGFQVVGIASASVPSLSRQSSSNSSSVSVQQFHQVRCSMDASEVCASMSTRITAMSSPLTAAAMANNAPSSTLSMGNNATYVRRTLANNAPSLTVSMGTLATPSPRAKAMTVGEMPSVKAASSTAQAFSAPTTVSPGAKQQGNSFPMKQVHLPEPPEADPQVMLSSLPEKGKLLQAVMQAGPLLQTLLLAGPLPQWRHPPPALSTGDIPKVSLVPSNVLLPYPTHTSTSLMQGPMGCYPINNGGSPSTPTRVRIANADPCSRSTKLRKLSLASANQGQLMPMLPGGEGRLAAGVSHSSTIY